MLFKPFVGINFLLDKPKQIMSVFWITHFCLEIVSNPTVVFIYFL